MSAGARRNSAVTFSAQAEAHASPRASPVMVWNCFGTHPPINPLVGCKRSYGWRSGSWNVWWGIAVHDLVCKDTCPQSQRARNRKFADSLLEEPGFEPLVPLCGVVVSRWNRNAGNRRGGYLEGVVCCGDRAFESNLLQQSDCTTLRHRLVPSDRTNPDRCSKAVAGLAAGSSAGVATRLGTP